MRTGMIVRSTLAMAGLVAALSATVHAGTLTVKVQQGKIHGKTINQSRVKAFLGLPYAAPPVGELRWRAPEPPAKWKGVRDATRFGARCAQNHIWDDMIFADSGPSENCLFLNVYAPAGVNAKSRLPVMFWIHGGAYQAGASSEPRHGGDFLPLKGVVLVTINYRLGVFGFLATADLAKEANGATGNYGLLDMVAALRWVRDNIAKFGGDPHNVTIFGESAGASAVATLMASPAARGLFQKAIGESVGDSESGFFVQDSLQAREKRDAAWVASLGVKSLAELRALPDAKILEASDEHGGIPLSPVVDGRLLTEPIPDTYAAGQQAHVPLLAGWNRDEDNALVEGMTPQKWKAYAAAHFKDRAAEFLRLYPGATDAQTARSAADHGGDLFSAFCTCKWLEAQCKTGAPADRSSSAGWKTGNAPVYRYHFELPAPPSKYHPGSFAFHSDDIEYVFGTLDSRPGSEWRPEDRKLSEQIMSYWTNFAKTGDPNGPGLPEWPKDCNDDEMLHLNSSIISGADTLRPRYQFLLKNAPAVHF